MEQYVPEDKGERGSTFRDKAEVLAHAEAKELHRVKPNATAQDLEKHLNDRGFTNDYDHKLIKHVAKREGFK